MRGQERQQTKLFSYVSPEQRIPAKHPIRTIRQLVDRALQALSPQFDALYAAGGRPSHRDRLLAGDVAQALFHAVLEEAQRRHLLSAAHFTIDGTLVRAWAGQKSFRRRGRRRPGAPDGDPGNPTVDFHGERRSNATHQSPTDPEACLAKKGTGHEVQLA